MDRQCRWGALVAIVIALGSVANAIAQTITTDKWDYLPGETVVITGSGWEPGETVSLLLQEDPFTHPDLLFYTVADENGDVYDASFVVEEHDLGVTFYLTATGLTSGGVAQVTFFDGACGNGNVQPNDPQNEQCDDGNNTNGDGCSDVCTIEPGWTCAGDHPSVCSTVCGDSIIAGTEQCDQGAANGTTTSCCTSTCTFRASGAVCRVSAGVCDPQETCSGSSGTCPADAFSPSSTVCRGSAGVCDVAENCTGSSAACPTDAKLGTSTICRGTAGVCDTAEVCNGTDDACPADGKLGTSTTCRGAAGACDAAEVCNGTDDACPADGKLGTSTTCRGAAGVCDAAEVCNGTDDACPADGKLGSSTTCRAAAGVCDAAEVCNGVANTCPANALQPSGTTCRASAGVCDTAETCSGASIYCPSNVFVSSSTVCRPSNGVCDIAENCTGSAAACPADSFKSSATICRASAGACDVAERCTGSSAACPANACATVGTSCGDSTANECTAADTCDGTCGSGLTGCATNNTECAFVTDSSLCPFDMYPTRGTCSGGGANNGKACTVGSTKDACCTAGGTCLLSPQFRLIFTPDVQLYPAYKQNASNPGQFFGNIIAAGTPGQSLTVTLNIPYPFVTQGANPVHIYDGNLRTQGGCFQPGSELGSRNVIVSMDDWLSGTQNGTLDCDTVPGPNGTGTCSFDVTATVPPSGLLYVNVHLDYGLKGNGTDANPEDLLADRYDRGPTASPWNTFDALINDTTTVGIKDGRGYQFGWDGPSQSYTDTVESMNEFKGINGAFGQVMSSLTEAPQPNAHLQLVKNSTRTVVASATTDVDGFYLLSYRHKGSPDTYTVYLLDFALTRTIELKGSGWGEVDFDVFTSTSTAVYGTGK